MEKLKYLYQLKLIPILLDESNWTDKENNIVQHHFEELQSWQRQGKLILAGKTLNITLLDLESLFWKSIPRKKQLI